MEILYPLFAMVLLTAVALFRLGYLRYRAVAGRQVDPAYYKTYQGNGEPDSIAATSRHVVNLFETPVLFYVAVLLAYQVGSTGAGLVALAWGFVAFRAVHSFIHCTYNNVNHRFVAYALSCLFLIFMWIRLGSFILAN